MPLTVYLAGDSTVAACPADETPMSGWGAHLAAPLNARLTQFAIHAGREPLVVPVVNIAKGGANTASHRGDGLWDALLLVARPGQVVILQFGHNDQKLPSLAARTGYGHNLERMVSDCRERRLRPILATPVARRTFVDGELVDSLGEYPEVVRQLASRLDVPLLDLNHVTSALYRELGDEDSKSLLVKLRPGEHPLYKQGSDDDTHYNIRGAITVAGLVAAELAPILDAWMPDL